MAELSQEGGLGSGWYALVAFGRDSRAIRLVVSKEDIVVTIRL